MTDALKKKIAVIGGGLMGSGIAFVFARAGFPVSICEPDDGRRENLPARMQSIAGLLETKPNDLADIAYTARIEDAARDAAFAIEAGPENLALKKQIFEELSSAASEDTILATNTSAIPISRIASGATKPERVLGAHFWNPPHLVQLVEVIQSDKTSQNAIDGMIALLRDVAMTPVLVKKDVPGFIGNRLQHALKREAIALVADGVCDAETVDTVVKLGFGARLPVMGPLEQSDLLGLELTLAIHETLIEYLDVTPGPHPLLRAKIASGKTGASVGEGFRKWTDAEAEAARKRLNDYLVSNAVDRYRGR